MRPCKPCRPHSTSRSIGSTADEPSRAGLARTLLAHTRMHTRKVFHLGRAPGHTHSTPDERHSGGVPDRPLEDKGTTSGCQQRRGGPHREPRGAVGERGLQCGGIPLGSALRSRRASPAGSIALINACPVNLTCQALCLLRPWGLMLPGHH